MAKEKHYHTLYAHQDLEQQHPYYLDRASKDIVEVLGIRSGESVLDMCAAPGGKAICIANALKGSGSLWVNDKERSGRLARVMRGFFPDQDIRITGHDARTMGLKNPTRFDAILLDAPCSSEWHWLKDPELLAHWRPTRPKRLAIDQYAMLASALKLLKVGGRCLYATCAINPLENEGVIAKALSRWGDKIRLDENVPSFAEGASRGFYVLPDRSTGGPLYGCLLWKVHDGIDAAEA
jgi:16S rRNA C967 or C1407 C5-methylase (RsmB/RsmF family)